MNRIYRVILNRSSGQWIVTSELGSSKKSAGSSLSKLATLGIASLFAIGTEAATEYTTIVEAAAGETKTLNQGDSVIPAAQAERVGAITANGSGAVINADGVTVVTHGMNRHGAYGNNGGTLNLTGTNIASDGFAVYVTGGTATLTDAILSTTGTGNGIGSIGIGGVTAHDSVLNIYGGQVTTNGQYAGAIVVKYSQAKVDNVNITTLGYANRGIDINRESDGDINHVTVTIEGDRGQGLYFNGYTLKLNDADILTKGASSNGVWLVSGIDSLGTSTTTNSRIKTLNGDSSGVATYWGTHSVSDSEVVTEGEGSRGIDNMYANLSIDKVTVTTSGAMSHGIDNYNGTLLAIGSTVNTTGSGAYGVNIYKGASVSVITDSKISTAGESAYGVAVSNTNTQINGGEITTTGRASTGVYLASDKPFSINGARVTTSGENAHGLSVLSSNATILNASITATGEGASAIFSQSGLNTFTLTASEVTGGSGTALSVGDGVQTSTMTMTADGSTFNGNLVVSANSAADVTLNSASLLKGATSNLTQMAMNDSQWQMSADSDIGVFTVNNSSVVFNAPVSGAFKTLTLGSLGGNGGAFTLNTVLNEGGASTQSDKVHVTGDASGDHTLIINNAGGLGALTVGDGIQVVAIDGSASGSFALGNTVSAGAYQYLLYQGGGSDANDWYLRSYLDAAVPAQPAAPDAQPQAESPAQGIIAYRPELVSYIAAPYLNEQYGFDVIGTRHERIGDRVTRADGAWGRIGGQRMDNESGRFNYKTDTWFAQLGADLYQSQSETAANSVAGVMMTLGHQSTDSRDEARRLSPTLSVSTGSVDSNIYSLGAYYTLTTQDNAYLDLVTQGSYYRNDYESDHNAKQNGYGVVLSAEGGKAFATGNGWDLEPQVQLMYQYLNLDGFSDDISSVSGVSHSSARARGGLRITKTMDGIKPYVLMDVVHNLTDSADVRVGQTKMSTDFTETWWQIGTGVSVKLSDNTAVYGDVKYQKDFSSEVDGYSGRLGVKVSF